MQNKNKTRTSAGAAIRKIIQTIKSNKRFLIVAHNNMDGDSFGSGLALGIALRNMNKTVEFLIKPSVPKCYAFLPKVKKIAVKSADLKKYKVLFALDTAGWGQLEGLTPILFKGYTIINIDHHIDNARFGAINWIDPKASAVGEMIYTLLKELKCQITSDIAKCLYTAILTDTGDFQFANTTARTHIITADLIQKGVLPSVIYEEIYEKLPASRLKLLHYMLGTLKLSDNNKIVWVWITKKMFAQSKTQREDSEGFVDYLKSISGSKIALVFKEGTGKEEVRVTLRSKDPKIHVNKIAHLFGGGGHPAAAGCTMYGSKKEVENRILAAAGSAIKGRK